jgi:DNA-binding MarR family transcriptional regulator
MTTIGDPLRARRSLIIAGEYPPEPSIQCCLESMGIFLLSEWDVLAFVHRHGTSLTSAQHISQLIGYDISAVVGALDRLERENLIHRSRTSEGVRFYRILDSTDAGRRGCLEQLVSLSESRAGRLLLTKQLRAARSESARQEHPARSGT